MYKFNIKEISYEKCKNFVLFFNRVSFVTEGVLKLEIFIVFLCIFHKIKNMIYTLN